MNEPFSDQKQQITFQNACHYKEFQTRFSKFKSNFAFSQWFRRSERFRTLQGMYLTLRHQNLWILPSQSPFLFQASLSQACLINSVSTFWDRLSSQISIIGILETVLVKNCNFKVPQHIEYHFSEEYWRKKSKSIAKFWKFSIFFRFFSEISKIFFRWKKIKKHFCLKTQK